MKALSRSALSAAVFASSIAVISIPTVARAQRVQAPGPDTKRVLVTAFRGDPEAGPKLANEVRDRVNSEFNIRQVMATSKRDIDATLTQSGYKPDSALNPNDIKELGKLVRADEVIDGDVTRLPNGSFRIRSRFFLPRDASLAQPLLTVESNNFGDVAKQIVKEFEAARKQLKANQDCENAIRANKPVEAIAAARSGIAEYSKATIARLCLATAYDAYKTTADSTGPWRDSVIAITGNILTLDPASRIAYQLQYGAYKAKMDTANAMQSLVGLMSADPTNTTLREQVINELVSSGKADVAVPLTRKLVADNPGDPQYARTYWLVLRAANKYKESVPAGEAYIALDSAGADSNYYFRQIADLSSDSMYAKAAEFSARGAAKFPRSASLLLLQAQNERRAGQLPAAQASLQRAIAIDPKATGANLLLAQISYDLGNPDDAIKAVKADVALDATNKDRDAALLLSFGNTAFKAAQASKVSADYRKALPLLQAADEMSSTANSKFLLAVTAFQALATSDVQKAKTCSEFKDGSDLLTIVNINMPGGGSVDANTARTILGAASQYQAFLDAGVKRTCK